MKVFFWGGGGSGINQKNNAEISFINTFQGTRVEAGLIPKEALLTTYVCPNHPYTLPRQEAMEIISGE